MKTKLYLEEEEAIMEAAVFFRDQLSGTFSKMSATEVSLPSPISYPVVLNPAASSPSPPLNPTQVRMTGIVPRLIQLLAPSRSPDLQHEAAWCLTNICSADHDDCQDVVDQVCAPEACCCAYI